MLRAEDAPVKVALLAPAFLLYGLFLIVPVGLFLLLGFFTFDPGVLYKYTLTLENFHRLFSSSIYVRSLVQTVRISLTVTAITLLLGYPLALFLWTTRSRLKGVYMFLIIAPLLTGIMVRTYGWMVILGNKGLINDLLRALHVTDVPLRLLNSEFAVVTALAQILLPYMVFPIFSALVRQDRDLVKAALSLGASPLGAFFQVTLPLSRGGIVAGCLLVCSLTAGSVVTPVLLGGTKVQMVGQHIYELVLHVLNWPLASAFATLLIVVEIALSLVGFRLVGARHG